MASVGHTDAMFFEFFERDDETPAPSPPSVASEAAAQLDAITEELVEALDGAAPVNGDGSRGH